MYKLLYKNPDCGLNITWRQLDHENRSELTYEKKICLKIIYLLIFFVLNIVFNIGNRKKS